MSSSDDSDLFFFLNLILAWNLKTEEGDVWQLTLQPSQVMTP